MNVSELEPRADRAALLLKTMGNPRRLMILCHLVDGERSAGELERLVGLRQSAVSQHLAKLRGHGLVCTRREGQSIYYALAEDGPHEIIKTLYRLYCGSAARGCNRRAGG